MFPSGSAGRFQLEIIGNCQYSIPEAGVISGSLCLFSAIWSVGFRVKASQACFDFLMISSDGLSNMVGESVGFKWTGLLLTVGKDSDGARGRR